MFTAEEAVRIGMEFRRLTSGEAFDQVIEVLKEQYRQKVFNSQPGETEVREEAYYQMRALEDLTTTIQTFIAIAEADSVEVDEDQISIFE